MAPTLRPADAFAREPPFVLKDSVILTPEMFELVSEDISQRGGAAQETQVFGLEAQVLGVVEEDNRYIVSVRFPGSTRDQHGAVPEALDEIWHLTKPRAGQGGWMIAGIQQREDGSLPA